MKVCAGIYVPQRKSPDDFGFLSNIFAFFSEKLLDELPVNLKSKCFFVKKVFPYFDLWLHALKADVSISAVPNFILL